MRQQVTQDYSLLLVKSSAFLLRVTLGTAVGLALIAALFHIPGLLLVILKTFMMALPRPIAAPVAGTFLGGIAGAIVVALFSVVTSSLRHELYRRALVENHLCTTCGYSLTGNSSGICPECGTAIEMPVEASKNANNST
jgi:predicted RNA-binding Zn-ribbon protein involved in translation (DUF1610 family)